MAEPLAVALHAVNRAGPLLGRQVLVTGCGPIGAMTDHRRAPRRRRRTSWPPMWCLNP